MPASSSPRSSLMARPWADGNKRPRIERKMGIQEVEMRVRLMIALGVLLTATSALAHHSFSSEYDSKQPITLKGLVTKIEWQNPHAYFYVNVKDDTTGAVTNWALEMGAPSGLQRQGWTRNTLQ